MDSGFGFAEMVILFVVCLLLFGPRWLPVIGKGVWQKACQAKFEADDAQIALILLSLLAFLIVLIRLFQLFT